MKYGSQIKLTHKLPLLNSLTCSFFQVCGCLFEIEIKIDLILNIITYYIARRTRFDDKYVVLVKILTARVAKLMIKLAANISSDAILGWAN